MRTLALVLAVVMGCGGGEPSDDIDEKIDALVGQCAGDASTILSSVVRIGGGPVETGAEVLSRNGEYVMLLGDCSFVCGSWNGEIYSHTIETSQARQLAREIYARRADAEDTGCLDAPTEHIDIQGETSVSASSCASAGPTSQWLESCVAAPFAQSVRYTLIEREAPWSAQREAASWPLAIALTSVATRASATRGEMHGATGADAAALLALRDRLHRGDFGQESRFIPIDHEGQRYELFVADAHPLEDANGLLPFGFRR